MRPSRRAVLRAGGGFAAAIAAPRLAVAQAWPTRPVTIIDTFAPGGSTGIIAHLLAEKMSAALGEQIIVDSRGGAGGTVGARSVASSAPDGYTLMLGFTGTLAIAPSLYAAPGYDPLKDFIAVGRIGVAPASLVVHPSFPPKTLDELIAYARANPGKVAFGTAGVGSVGHVAGELLSQAAGIRLAHVPYRGTAPALTDLLGGHIPMTFSPLPATRDNVRRGELRILGVTSLSRSRIMPEVPTMAEQGLQGYEAVLRYGIVAPAGTPRAIVDRLNAEMRKVLASEEIIDRLSKLGVEPMPSTPEDYAADVAREQAKYSALIRSLGLRAE